MSSFPRADDYVPIFAYDFAPPGPNDFIFNHDPEDSLSVVEAPLPDKLPSFKDYHNTRPPSYSNRKYSFSTKYEKFHVTPNHRAGYNKIYNFRRSRSFFFELVDLISDTNQIELKIHTNDYHMSSNPIQHTSTSRLPNIKFQISKLLTHFFSTQKVIPRRLQSKFFGLLRKKLLERYDFIKSRAQKSDSTNHMTKTFSTSRIKNIDFILGFIFCVIMFAPIVVSTLYHKLVLYTTPKNETLPNDNNHHNSKNFHADLLHRRWASKRIYNHFSQCLGISFDTKYHAYGLNNVVKKGNDFIYGKVYFNFKHRHSTSSRTEKRQRARFESLQKRLLNEKLSFDEEQHICKRLKHLSYKKKFISPSQSYYNFLLPFPDQDIGIIPVQSVKDNNVPTDVLIVPTDSPVQPVKDNNVPTDELIVSTDLLLDKVPSYLIPLIPEEPFYEGGRLNQPSAQKIKKKKLQPLTVGSDAWLAHMNELYQEHEMIRKYNENLLAYTIKWGVDSKRADYRESLLLNVIDFTDAFHNFELKKLEIASRPPALPVPKDTKKGKKQNEQRLADKAASALKAQIKMDNEILEDLWRTVRIYEDTPSKTRCDAELYEPEIAVMDVNLNKRRADINSNLDSHHGLFKPKRFV
ncbi:unnamed protein product [Rhizophagus irregularis]|nr:unnamed protein product [Rhizophagus irregularis]